MIDLGKWAFGHSKLVYFLLAVLLVGGLKSAYDMGKLEDPEVKVKSPWWSGFVRERRRTKWNWK